MRTGDFIHMYGVAGLNAYLVQRRAEIALPFLLAIHCEHERTLNSWTAWALITAEAWRDAGTPSKAMRMKILARLRKMPDLVTLHFDPDHTPPRCRIKKGPAWRVNRHGWPQKPYDGEGAGGGRDVRREGLGFPCGTTRRNRNLPRICSRSWSSRFKDSGARPAAQPAGMGNRPDRRLPSHDRRRDDHGRRRSGAVDALEGNPSHFCLPGERRRYCNSFGVGPLGLARRPGHPHSGQACQIPAAG